MKNFIRFSTILLPMLLLAMVAIAQPKQGSVLLIYFSNQISQVHNATVIAVNGNEFTCRFSQTNSEYTFKHESEGVAKTVSTKGGKNAAGTTAYYSEVFIIDDSYGCIQNKSSFHQVIVKFSDGKAFIGSLTDKFSAEGNFEVKFLHSGNSYIFNKDGVVQNKTGGVYNKGSQAKIFCASLGYLPPEIKPQLQEQKHTRQ